MMEYRVRLSQDDVPDFVTAAENCDCDVDIFYNRFIIDAKSILGVMSLDLRQPLTVRIAERDERFERQIRRFSIA
ncbi:MAG: HPr family phosphocarrier protein [Lachnospiraceae bacterium]|nr:HPr family phosphocarrier protein [Lachnospiraceae bacterium]